MNYLNKKHSIPLVVICFVGVFVGEVHGNARCCWNGEIIGSVPYDPGLTYHESHADAYCQAYLNKDGKRKGKLTTCCEPATPGCENVVERHMCGNYDCEHDVTVGL